MYKSLQIYVLVYSTELSIVPHNLSKNPDYDLVTFGTGTSYSLLDLFKELKTASKIKQSGED